MASQPFRLLRTVPCDISRLGLGALMLAFVNLSPTFVAPKVAPPLGRPRQGGVPLALAASVGVARACRSARRYFGGFKPVVCERDRYCNDCGYLPDGTPMSQVGNKSLKAAQAAAVPPAPELQTALHGINFGYAMQKDSYADLEFLNDVGGSTLARAWEPIRLLCFALPCALLLEATCRTARR